MWQLKSQTAVYSLTTYIVHHASWQGGTAGTLKVFVMVKAACSIIPLSLAQLSTNDNSSFVCLLKRWQRVVVTTPFQGRCTRSRGTKRKI